MSCDHFCPTVRVFDPPVTVVNDVFHPQIVEVIHQVNVVTRHHCVPVEKHLYQYCYSDENHNDHDHDKKSCGHKSHHRSNRSHSRGRNSFISKAKANKKSKKSK